MPSLFSRRAIAVVAAIVTTAAGWLIAAPPASAAEDTVSFPLRHSFSMAVGLPGAGRHEPTSCYDVEEGKNYICRIVSGYEETGDKRTFFVSSNDVLEQGSDPSFGITLVDAKGTQYEGCAWFDPYTYWCDYASREQVSRQHYESGHWVLKVLWQWEKVTNGQFGCAAALSGLWSGPGGKAFLTLLRNCQNGPLMDPLR